MTPTESPNVAEANASVDKDNPTPEEIQAAEEGIGQDQVPASDPNKPTEILDETAKETADRHVASTELPVGDLTDPASQSETPLADMAKDKIVPGAAVGPDAAGVVRNDHGRVAYAPPGSYNAAVNGVQEDASGHVSSVNTDNSHLSGTRI